MNWLKKIFDHGSAPAQPAPPSEPESVFSIPELRAKFGHLSRPAVHLRPARHSRFSKLGGLPLLPADAQWPVWNDKPQSFLAQLDLAEIHAALPSFLPATGCLYFFYDQDQGAWGFDPDDSGSWRVLYATGDRSTFKERPAPEGLAPEFIYKEKPVAARCIELLPHDHGLTRSSEETWDNYAELRGAPFEGMHHHQMLGYPAPVQNDDMELECQLASKGIYVGTSAGYKDPRVDALKEGAADWKLLLQLDTDDDTGWMWGDAGTLYFWIREQDAAKGDFSKVWMVFQCS
ncbi:MAG: YwqG family protein [Opitutaceae bacterium]|jgi:uncharacterized protein YwqG